MSSRIQLISVDAAGDAAILARREGVDDLGSVETFLAEAADDHAVTSDGLVRLVTTADPASLTSTRVRLAQLAAIGVVVDAVIVTRVPSAKDDWPKVWAKAQRRAVAAFERTCPVPVVTKRLRQHGDPIGSKQSTKRLRRFVEPPEIETNGEGYRWQVPIDALDAITELRVGTAGTVEDGAFLVIDLDDVQAWRPLPSLLARCVATAASADDAMVTVDFVRDLRLWPEESA